MGFLLSPEGKVVTVPDDQMDRALEVGYRPLTPEQAGPGLTQPVSDADSLASAAVAGVSAAASGATLGATDALLAAIGDRGSTEALRQAREAHPVVSTTANIAGAIAGAALTGGESLAGAAAPARLATEGGRTIAAGMEAAGMGRIGGAVLGGAAEGAIFGAGQGVSELALSDDPLTFERAASTLSSNVLFGGAVGGAAGLAAAGLERGLLRAKGAIDARLSGPVAEQLEPDLATMTRRDLDVAAKTEREAIDVARQPEREAFVQALRDHEDATQAEQLWDYTSKHPNRYVRGLGKESREADIKVRNLLKNETGLARNPLIARDALERQAQVLSKIESEGLTEHAQFMRDFDRGPATIRQQILDGKVEGYIVGKGGLSPTSPLIDEAVNREMVKRFGTADIDVQPTIPARLQAVMDSGGTARTRVGNLRQMIEALAAEPTSARLTQIEAAREALSTPHAKSLGETVFHAIPFAGRMAEIASVAGRVAGGLRGAIGKAGQRAGAAASSFLDVAAKGAARAVPVAPIAATKILGELRYAPAAGDEQPPPPKGKATLAALYKRRTDEIKSQTAYDETGMPRLRPEARAAMGARLAPIRATYPILADRIETLAARRIEYLSSLIPRRPDLAGIQMGPDRWQPSDMAMRGFARSAAAAEDPHAVLERAASGSIAPEDVATLRATAPEELADFTRKIAAELPLLQRTLPPARRLALSLLTGLPVDPAMDPAILSVLQAQYTYELERPQAQPQFGSVKNRTEVGTASQRREEGSA